MIENICCIYCIKTGNCPVLLVSPWNRWDHFCSEFLNINNQDIRDIIIKQYKESKSHD